MKRIISFVTGLLLLAVAALAHSQEPYEVWAVDQSDSMDGTATGGVLYVFRGTDEDYLQGKASRTHQIDLLPAAVAGGFEGGLEPHMTLSIPARPIYSSVMPPRAMSMRSMRKPRKSSMS